MQKIIKIANSFFQNSVRYAFTYTKARPASVPILREQYEEFKFNNLHGNPGSKLTSKRLGRGPASGKG